MQQQSKLEHHVSLVTKLGGKGAGGSGGSLVDKIKGGSYSQEQFNSLTQVEKDRVAKHRAETNKKKKAKKHEKERRRESSRRHSQNDLRMPREVTVLMTNLRAPSCERVS
jgi:hypothetical protein